MSKPTLSELRQRYVVEGRPLPRAVERDLLADPRGGAQAVLAAVRERRRRNRAELRRLRDLLAYERACWEAGAEHVVGMDEVGMGPMAGPVVAAAVVLPPQCRIVGIDDSKRLDAATRERLVPEIRAVAVAWGIGRVPPDEIDAVGLHRAGLLAMERAVARLGVVPHAGLVDGRHVPQVPFPTRAIVKGDRLSMSIAAASILAKVSRDAEMIALERVYPGYGFAQHKGYPVSEHRDALERLGATPIHRRCFELVRNTAPR